VPPITNVAPHRDILIPPTPLHMQLPQRSTCNQAPMATTTPTQLPHVRCVPIARGVCRTPLISQEAINLLTECVWAESPNIFTPDKLQPKHSEMNFVCKQLATPMVHTTTGKTISSYKKSCMTLPPRKYGKLSSAKTLEAWPKAIIKPVKKELLPSL
jgi:hypothetical protein